jgi:1-deoxy-D-xylulose-5-phosphate reductoisomerase
VRQAISILGSTGSIGQSTLDVCQRHPDRYQVFALTAATSVQKMLSQIKRFSPRYAVMAEEASAKQLAAQLPVGCDTQVLFGVEALAMVSSHERVDMVMAAIVGAAGLVPTLAAAQAGKRVLLANKESLVMAGPLFMDAVREGGATLLPIDSEHNAIFQSLPHDYQSSFDASGVRKILLTASGGPFRGWCKEKLTAVTPAQAVAHPNWSMGQKISVDSATLMNKGLELIEACFLFGCNAEQVEVVVHPQSVIHSMVQYADGSVLAQLGQPDMRTPIAYGMAWPERIDAGVQDLDVFDIARLDFEAPDEDAFPALALARQAFRLGGTSPAVLNAANEVAVDAFLSEQIAFTAIPELVAHVMERHVQVCEAGQMVLTAVGLDHVLAADDWARSQARSWVQRH